MAVIIKTFLVQPFYVPSESMLPTIVVNDRVMISKLNYRFADPQRGDIVVFISPFNDDIDNESLLEVGGSSHPRSRRDPYRLGRRSDQTGGGGRW